MLSVMKKATHSPHMNEQRLTLLSWSAPLLAQFIMLVVVCMQRHWLYAAMLAPGMLGSALMLGYHGHPRQARGTFRQRCEQA